VRQLAWLHAVPEGSKKSRLTALKDSSGDDSVFLQFPELDGAGYLVALLQEAGLVMSNGMGVIPITWQEIDSWLRVTELELSVWEKLTIREMSEAYAAEFSKSSDKHAVAPYAPPAEPTLDRAAVSSKIANILRGFKRKKEGT
jgi:hypothetical protein